MINNQISALSSDTDSSVNTALVNYSTIPLLLVWVTASSQILEMCRARYKEEFQYAIQTISFILISEKLKRLRTLILS